MKDYSTKNIINLALTGHATTGKTTLAEAMACNAGIIHKMGSINAGTLFQITGSMKYKTSILFH